MTSGKLLTLSGPPLPAVKGTHAPSVQLCEVSACWRWKGRDPAKCPSDRGCSFVQERKRCKAASCLTTSSLKIPRSPDGDLPLTAGPSPQERDHPLASRGTCLQRGGNRMLDSFSGFWEDGESPDTYLARELISRGCRGSDFPSPAAPTLISGKGAPKRGRRASREPSSHRSLEVLWRLCLGEVPFLSL